MQEKKGKKIIKKLAFLYLSLLMLTGCQARQLEEREFAQAMELEWDGKQLFGGFGTFVTTGNSVKDIREAYQEQLDKYLDLGHVKVLILGEELLKNKEVLASVLKEMENMPVLARNILVLSYGYEEKESILEKIEKKGIVPGEYISNLYKNNPDRPTTSTLGEVISTFQRKFPNLNTV